MSLIFHLLCKKLWLACQRPKHPQFEFTVTEPACTDEPCSLYRPRCRGRDDLAGVTVWVFGFPGCCGVSSTHRPTDVGLKRLRGGGVSGGNSKFNSRSPPTLPSRRWDTRIHAGLPEGCSVPGMRSLTRQARTRCCHCAPLGGRMTQQSRDRPGTHSGSAALATSWAPHTAPGTCWEVSSCAPLPVLSPLSSSPTRERSWPAATHLRTL